MNIFDTEWNVIVTIGTNCTNASIVKKNGMRYFSSPFATEYEKDIFYK